MKMWNGGRLGIPAARSSRGADGIFDICLYCVIHNGGRGARRGAPGFFENLRRGSAKRKTRCVTGGFRREGGVGLGVANPGKSKEIQPNPGKNL